MDLFLWNLLFSGIAAGVKRLFPFNFLHPRSVQMAGRQARKKRKQAEERNVKNRNPSERGGGEPLDLV